MKRACGTPTEIAKVAMLLLQLFVGLVLPFYHAQVEAQDLTHEVHISAPSTSDCIPHNDIGCQICRSSGLHEPLIAGNLLVPPPEVPPVIPQDRCDTASRAQHELLAGIGSRAPPSV
jgi:hypothetical protein